MKKQEDKKNHLQELLCRLEKNIEKKKRARSNIYELMEEEEINLKDLKDRLKINQDEILDIESSLTETKSQYQEIVTLAESEKEVITYWHNNKKQLRKLTSQILKLNFKDRKLLVESMLKDKVIVDYQDANEFDGPGGAVCHYQLKWNPDILQRFMNEGKIARLNQNSTYNTS